VDRAEVAAFLRTRRERLGPGDIGLPTATRRRTPGLRREEVALLAGVSVDYYTRLEQARGPHPSQHVLAALARALRLTNDERDHLFRLAGEPAPEPQARSEHLRPGVLHLLDRLADSAVMVVNDVGDVLAWTPLAQALFTDFSALPAGQRNLYRIFFTGPEGLHRLPPRTVNAERARTSPTCAPPPRGGAATRPCGAWSSSSGGPARCSSGSGPSTTSRSDAPTASGSSTRWSACSSWTARCC
jgi:transcriptional regulator with XRE-family HTH domain